MTNTFVGLGDGGENQVVIFYSDGKCSIAI